MNVIYFKNSYDKTNICNHIINVIVYRSWNRPKLRSKIVQFMMSWL